MAKVDASRPDGAEEYRTYDDDSILGKAFPDVSGLKAVNPEAYGAPKPGQVVVFYLWAQFHKPGYAFFPRYSQLAEKYGDKVAFVAMSVDPDISYPTKFWKDPAKKYSTLFTTKFAMAWDDGKVVKDALQKAGQLSSLPPPHAYVVDANGIIRWHQDHSELGATVRTYLDVMEEQIDALLENKPLKSVGDRPEPEGEEEAEEEDCDVEMDGDGDDAFAFL